MTIIFELRELHMFNCGITGLREAEEMSITMLVKMILNNREITIRERLLLMF